MFDKVYVVSCKQGDKPLVAFVSSADAYRFASKLGDGGMGLVEELPVFMSWASVEEMAADDDS